MRAEGKSVISLALGEPDFETPAGAIAAAHAAAERGFTKYTAPDGDELVKRAVSRKLARDNDLAYGLDEIHVVSGSKQVIFNAFAATLNSGDEVVLPTPCWVSYADVVELCGGVPVFVETKLEQGFLPDPDAVARAMSARTKWLVINSPNNPTGAVVPSAILESLAALVRYHPNAMIMSDEIYEHMVFDGGSHVSVVNAVPKIRDRTLIVNGVSKSYAMTGWRIGFGAGPAWLIKAMAKIQSQTAGNAASVCQAAAAAAMDGDQMLLADRQWEMQARRDVACAVLEKCTELRVFRPQGAFYVFIDVGRCLNRAGRRDVARTDVELAEHILLSTGVATVPGSAFGASPYLRLSLAIGQDDLREACGRIVEYCDGFAEAVTREA